MASSAISMPLVLSEHAKSLSAEDRSRLITKLQELGCNDPYSYHQSLWKADSDLDSFLPPVTEKEIFSYLVYRRNGLTLEQFEAFKSLDAKKYADNGFVQNLRGIPLADGRAIIRADVFHSQALSLHPLQPWAGIHPTGDVIYCHCDCVAGYV